LSGKHLSGKHRETWGEIAEPQAETQQKGDKEESFDPFHAILVRTAPVSFAE
jgi:hypothetical protein